MMYKFATEIAMLKGNRYTAYEEYAQTYGDGKKTVGL